MKSESNIKPTEFIIEKCDNIAEITLYENIEEQERNGETIYGYDEYRITVPYRDNLASAIQASFPEWLEEAKKKEYDKISNEARTKRNQLLAESDWTQCVDSPLSEEQKEAWAIYRQALRDIPDQAGFPYEIIYPRKP